MFENASTPTPSAPSRLAVPGARCAAVLATALLAASAASAQLWPARNRVLVSPLSAVANAKFGDALAAGDFDGDGFDDLVVGEPWRTIGGQTYAGAITFWMGGPGGLAATHLQHLHPGLADDFFGSSFAVGDFDGDGDDELAVGMPRYDDFYSGTERVNSGYVWIYEHSDGFMIVTGQVSQAPAGVDSDPETEDMFGAALAAGDFDGDGDDDLAISAPGEDQTIDEVSYVQVGLVHIFEGSPGGLDTANAQSWSYGLNISGTPQSNQDFGTALAGGDLNRDGFEDLAIGVPRRNESQTVSNSGYVWIVYGSINGLQTIGIDSLNENYGGTSGGSHLYGAALAIGDVDRDANCVANMICTNDLIVAAPYAKVYAGTDKIGAGRIYVYESTSGGPDSEDTEPITQSTIGGGESVETGDHFGFALAVGDFDGAGGIDLVAGSPDEANGATPAVGAVHLAWGVPTSFPDNETSVLLRAIAPWSSGPAAQDDRFGDAFAVGDFDGSGTDDLAIGIPGRDVSGLNSAGAVQVIYSALFADGFEGGTLAAWSNF